MSTIDYKDFSNRFIEKLKQLEVDADGFTHDESAGIQEMIDKDLPEVKDRIEALGVVIADLSDDEIVKSFGEDKKDAVTIMVQQLTDVKDLLILLDKMPLKEETKPASEKEVSSEAATEVPEATDSAEADEAKEDEAVEPAPDKVIKNNKE